jgi:hypothetical protein
MITSIDSCEGYELDDIICLTPVFVKNLRVKWPKLYFILRDFLSKAYKPHSGSFYIITSRTSGDIKRTTKWLNRKKISAKKVIFYYDYAGRQKPSMTQKAQFKINTLCAYSHIDNYYESDAALFEIIKNMSFRKRLTCKLNLWNE